MYRKAPGFTLIEVLIALALNGILMTGLISIFTNTSMLYRIDTAISNVQENGRFATDFMMKELRLVGYLGCIDPDSIVANVIANNPPTTNFMQASVTAYEVTAAGWVPAVDASIADLAVGANQPIVGSDVITIQRASDLDVSLSGNMASGNADIQIAGNAAGFVTNDLITITDCESADIFRASSVSSSSGTTTIAHASTINSSNNLSKAYQSDARIMKFYSNTFFVRDTGRDNYAGNPIHAMYRRDAAGIIVELFEGVSNLQLLYGEELASGLVRYVTASQAGLNMGNVKSIRFGVLIQSKSSSLSAADDRTYALPGQNVSVAGTAGATAVYAQDLTHKKVFVSTIKVRNRR